MPRSAGLTSQPVEEIDASRCQFECSREIHIWTNHASRSSTRPRREGRCPPRRGPARTAGDPPGSPWEYMTIARGSAPRPVRVPGERARAPFEDRDRLASSDISTNMHSAASVARTVACSPIRFGWAGSRASRARRRRPKRHVYALASRRSTRVPMRLLVGARPRPPARDAALAPLPSAPAQRARRARSAAHPGAGRALAPRALEERVSKPNRFGLLPEQPCHSLPDGWREKPCRISHTRSGKHLDRRSIPAPATTSASLVRPGSRTDALAHSELSSISGNREWLAWFDVPPAPDECDRPISTPRDSVSA